MAYGLTDMSRRIAEDLKMMEGHRATVKAYLFEKIGTRKVSPDKLHVNPDDEFSDPNIGPNNAIIENYSQIARRNSAEGLLVYEEPIIVNKLREGGYLILNGHHRWAGAIRARVKEVRISITDPT